MYTYCTTYSSNVNSPYLSDSKYLLASIAAEPFPYFNSARAKRVSLLNDPLICACSSFIST